MFDDKHAAVATVENMCSKNSIIYCKYYIIRAEYIIGVVNIYASETETRKTRQIYTFQYIKN